MEDTLEFRLSTQMSASDPSWILKMGLTSSPRMKIISKVYHIRKLPQDLVLQHALSFSYNLFLPCKKKNAIFSPRPWIYLLTRGTWPQDPSPLS